MKVKWVINKIELFHYSSYTFDPSLNMFKLTCTKFNSSCNDILFKIGVYIFQIIMNY